MGIKGKKWIRKPASLVMAIAITMSLASCSSGGESHSIVKHVTKDECTVYVIEQVSKKDKVIDEKQYYITFETPDEAWEFVYGTD